MAACIWTSEVWVGVLVRTSAHWYTARAGFGAFFSQHSCRGRLFWLHPSVLLHHTYSRTTHGKQQRQIGRSLRGGAPYTHSAGEALRG